LLLYPAELRDHPGEAIRHAGASLKPLGIVFAGLRLRHQQRRVRPGRIRIKISGAALYRTPVMARSYVYHDKPEISPPLNLETVVRD
ncbi:hypothetical protein, partial [Hyphomonas chukchiensis]|uniref:hypothetical protein n=1 Tax=Hyphomonas chukchiensis TaxID=1280947 RepID=UPI00054E5A48